MAIEFRYLCEEKIVLSRTCVAAEDMGIGNMEGRGGFFFCMHAWVGMGVDIQARPTDSDYLLHTLGWMGVRNGKGNWTRGGD